MSHAYTFWIDDDDNYLPLLIRLQDREVWCGPKHPPKDQRWFSSDDKDGFRQVSLLEVSLLFNWCELDE